MTSPSDSRPGRQTPAPYGARDLARAGAFLEELREDVIQRLGVHFASGDVRSGELERRLALALRATTPDALDLLVADLPALEADGAPQGGAAALVSAEPAPERGVIAAFMGGSVRKGTWILPRHLKVVAVMGGAELDLRAARFAPGVTEIEVLVIMGGVEILVPQGVHVEAVAVAAMGGIETNVREGGARDPDAPVLRISGLATMGGVEVKTRQADTKKLTRFAKLLDKARAQLRRERGR